MAHAPTHDGPRLIAVASGKGGVGKTVLAIGMAQARAAAGERVLLVDGDLGLANVDVQLGITPRGDLMEVVSGGRTLASAVTPVDGGAQQSGGFDVVAGRSGSGTMAALSGRELAGIAAGLRLIAAHYDRVFVDLAAGIEPGVLTLARACGRVAVVVTDEPTSLTDAYALIKLLRREDPEADIMTAVNQCESPEHGRRVHDGLARACERFLGFRPVFGGGVPRDRQVREAIRAQSPVLKRFPASAAARALAPLADALSRASAGDSGVNAHTARLSAGQG